MASKAKEESIEAEGRVVESLANTTFRVALDVGGECMAHIAGKVGDASTFDVAFRNAGTQGLTWATT